MAFSVQKLREQLAAFVGSLSTRARVLISAAVLLVGGALAYLVLVDRTEYAVLFSGLATDDAVRITEALRKTRTPFRLEGGGATLLVPSEKVHELRLQLAGQGLPRGAGVGFEIFDTQKFGLSDFAQQVNYRRALQGELERTIQQLDAVAAARVHIALPEKQAFARRAGAVTASVTIRLQPGRSLSAASVSAVVHLVSSSVAGLTPEQITIVDTAGSLLWSGRDGGAGGTGGPLDQKRKLEENLERRLGELLDAAIGPGRSVVKIAAEVALVQVEQTETQYDPEAVAVRSETSLEEKDARGVGNAAGIPGVQANLPGGPTPQTSGADAASQRKSMTRNYEITQTVRKQVSPAGQLRRLSVAVLVDQNALAAPTPAPTKAGGKAARGAKSAAAAPALDLHALEQVVREAVGYDAKRGDLLTLRAVPFAPEQKLEPSKTPWTAYLLEGNGPRLVLGGLGALVLLVLMLRRGKRVQPPQTLLALPRTVRELEASTAGTATTNPPALAAASVPGHEPAPQELAAAAAEHDAARAASVLKAWMARE
jgi:flagellar M-ring protein FliF